jgi:hypothetical protein
MAFAVRNDFAKFGDERHLREVNHSLVIQLDTD